MSLAIGGVRRIGVAVPVALVLGWAVLWLATVPRGDFPLNDDWTYALAVKSVLETGRFTLLPWASANVFAQVYWGALFCKLFGFSYEALRVSTAVLGAVGVAASYLLLREMLVGVGTAALGALVLGCNPLYLSQSVTFMSDVPFAAVVIVVLWLVARGMRRESRAEGWAAFGLGLVAVLIRQFAVVLPFAFAAGWVRRRRVSAGMVAAVAGSVVLFAALHVGFQKWMVATGRTSGFDSPVSALLHADPGVALQRLRSTALPAIGLLGMSLWPMALVDPGRFWGGRGWRLVGGRGAALVLAGVLLAALYVKREVPPLPSNVLDRFGIGPLTLSDLFQSKRHLPAFAGADGFWTVVTWAGCWGAAVGVMAVVASLVAVLRGRREGSVAQAQAAVLLGFIAAYGGALVAFVTIAMLFDRYEIPLLAPGIALIAVAGGERRRAALAAAGVVVAGMATFSVLATHDWLAWQRSRWAAVGYLEARSIPATEIDGGYEYNGLFTYKPVAWWATRKPGWWVVDDEYAVAGGAAAGYHEIASFPVETWLWRDGARVVVLKRD